MVDFDPLLFQVYFAGLSPSLCAASILEKVTVLCPPFSPPQKPISLLQIAIKILPSLSLSLVSYQKLHQPLQIFVNNHPTFQSFSVFSTIKIHLFHIHGSRNFQNKLESDLEMSAVRCRHQKELRETRRECRFFEEI